MNTRVFGRVLVLALAAGSLAGCGDAMNEAFGIDRNSPNEFTVTTRAPLAMPPDEALPAPSPGAPRPQEQAPRLQALEAIAPDVALQGTGGVDSPGQDALLADASSEASRPVQGELRGGTGVVGDLMFWRNKPAEILVNADAENRRLRRDANDGDPPTDGPTPALAPK